jgi:microcystin-dependent protein
MADPTTSNKLLVAPARGADSGTWDVPVNADWTALDGMLGGVTSIALTSATTILLTVPATGIVSPTAGPNQSQNALLKFTGTLTGNCVVQFTLPGFYIVQNLCTAGTSFVQLQPAAGTAGGNAIGAPPGRKCHVFYDGTSMDYVDMPETGSFLDLAVSTTPAWMNACTVAPYLVTDSSTYNISTYPTLGAMLGSTFGGNGLTTFAVPDTRARYRIPLDNQGSQGAANRVTAPNSGVNGTTIGSGGGSELLATHTHNATVADPGHFHVTPGNLGGVGASGGGLIAIGDSGTHTTQIATTGIVVNIQANGGGGAQNIPPGLVFGMTFIKT